MNKWVCITAFVQLISIVQASVFSINPADVESIRFVENDYWRISGLSVNLDFQDETKAILDFEDRLLIEFDISCLSGTIPNCTLDLSYGKFYDGVYYVPPSDSIIDVFMYVDDGVISVTDFFAGGSSPFISFIGEDGYERGYGYTQIDVTSVIQAAVSAGEKYLGFRLSTQTDAAFSFGRSIAVPDPVLTLVPEPATILLLGLGAVMLRRKTGRPC